MMPAEGAGLTVPLRDEGLARRLKALACTAPLHDLDARKVRLDWCDASVYQMAEIALQAIDQVTIAMDFDRGADHGDVVKRLLPFIEVQAPDRYPEEYARVAQWVLENLINVGSTDRGFRALYGTFGETGAYERRVFDFKLLIELVSPDGEIYLRASDEAINVLVGALDTDVESAQIAAEVKLENLIKRGRLSDAQLAAQQARYRTVQYAETLRRKLEATRRDVRAVDWEHEVPDLIGEALTHIEGRYRAENAILVNITQTRDEAEEPVRKRRAAELVAIVNERLGQVVDEATASPADQVRPSGRRDGLSLILSGVRASLRPKGVRVDMLKPDAVLRDERARVAEIGDVFSGGQQLTAAIILYCTMAWLRAGERGQAQRPHAGVLFLDNPIGRASAGYLLELQMAVAEKLGVQLVYTTGLFDTNALSVFPLIVRLRNDADLRAGMKYLSVDKEIRALLPAEPPDDTGVLTASRVFLRQSDQAQ